jgi:hypothetical protein
MTKNFWLAEETISLLHSKIRILPGRVCKLNLACAILHNFVILQREPMGDDHDVDEVDYDHDGELQDGISDKLFRFGANQSLLFPLNAMYLAEKQ